MERPSDSKELSPVKRRPRHGAPLQYVTFGLPGSVRFALSRQPEDLDRALVRINAVVIKLPKSAVAAQKRAAMRRAGHGVQGTVLRTYAEATRRCPEVRMEAVWLIEPARKLARYEGLRYKAGKGLNEAMDLRLLLAGQMFHLLGGVLKAVVERLSAKDCTRQEREHLETRFSRLLLHKDLLLQTREERVRARAQKRQEMDAEVEAVERRTLVADVQQAVRQGRPVDPAVLAQVARYHAEDKAAAAADAVPEPVLSPPPRARRTRR